MLLANLMRLTDHPMFGITQLKNGSYRVKLIFDGKPKTKDFGAKLNGGDLGALAAAQAHRDRLLPTSDAAFRSVKPGMKPGLDRGRAPSGIRGVQLNRKMKAGEVVGFVWIALLKDKELLARKYPGKKSKTVAFSVARYGYGGAFRRAAQAMADILGESIDVDALIVPPPPQHHIKELSRFSEL